MNAAPWREPRFRDALRAHLGRYATADDARGARELLTTVLAFVALLTASAWLLRRGLAWSPLTALSLALLSLTQVRLFLVHHDLCHQSLFAARRANLVLAPLVGALCSTSSHVWRREHDRHHRDSNNLDRPQDGQTAPWTVEQYRRAPRWQRRLYRVLNARPVLFGVVPPLYFLGFMHLTARWYENALFALVVFALWRTGTLPAFALALGPATWFGFLLFHAQHTGPALVRRHAADWDHLENGLRGSTFLVAPRALDWFLYGVAFHHVHHLHPGIPAWRQGACHEAGKDFFDGVPRLSLREAVKTTALVLYDEARQSLVSWPTGT